MKNYNKIGCLAKRTMSVNYLGGKCMKCCENRMHAMIFHHRDPSKKEFSGLAFRKKRWADLKRELDKCDLLCQNCHRELHYDKPTKYNEDRRLDKKIYLEYSGGVCIKCGYNKCPASLTFHHRDPKEKEFWIGSLSERINSIDELDFKIKKEIDKCDLLCANCHTIEYSDLIYYELNKVEINRRISNYREIQSKIPRDDVYRMYDNGILQKDIAKYFNTSNGTISGVLKEYKKSKKPNIKNVIIDDSMYENLSKEQKIYKLYNNGVRKSDICKRLNIPRSTVFNILKNMVNKAARCCHRLEIEWIHFWV